MAKTWLAYAACDGIGPSIFYSFVEEEQAEAIAICDVCGVREKCLKNALDNREEYGIWGGMTGPERLKMRRRIMRQVRKERLQEAKSNG